MNTDPHTSLQCLAFIARHHGIDLAPERLMHDYAVTDKPVTNRQLLRMAKDAGLRARQATLSWTSLVQMGEAYPVLAQLDNGNWVIIASATAGGIGAQQMIRVLDPLAHRPEELLLTEEQFAKCWHGTVILAKRNFRLSDADQPFGFRWFVPELVRQRSLFVDVAMAAFVLYALGLAMPIFFQLVIDKVLVHETYATLTVLTIGIGVALIFDAVFGFLRRYLLLYATNKIDIGWRHGRSATFSTCRSTLFEHASAGVLVKHMQQTEAHSRVPDRAPVPDSCSMACRCWSFLPVLLLYSVKLTACGARLRSSRRPGCDGAGRPVPATAAGSLPGRRRAAGAARRNRSRHATRSNRWRLNRASAASGTTAPPSRSPSRFQVEKISAVAQSLTGLLEKLMSVAIIGLGALDVFSTARSPSAR